MQIANAQLDLPVAWKGTHHQSGISKGGNCCYKGQNPARQEDARIEVDAETPYAK